MKQLLQDLRAQKPHLAEVPIPTPGPGFVLVRNAASLVSAGTERALVEFAGRSLVGKARSRPDLMRQFIAKAEREGILSTTQAALGRLNDAIPLGYSSAGTIEELGGGVPGFRVGQRVACAGGGYAVHAEYVPVPMNLVAELPKSVGFESAAFATLGAIALHGFRLSGARLGENVGVIGLGLLGQLAASIARAAGCNVLGIDLDKSRMELAHTRGVRAVVRSQAESTAAAQTRGHGMDSVLVCADTQSNDPIELAGEIARDRGMVVVIGAVGMQVPRRSYYGKELSLVVSRSYGPGRYDTNYEEKGRDYPIAYIRWTEGRNLQAFVDLLGSGAVEVGSLISHRFSVEKAGQAYELIRGRQSSLGVLITYPDTAGKISVGKTIQFSTAKPVAKGKIRLGVLGAGNYARHTLLPTLKGLKGLELVGIASASGRQAAELGKRYGFRYATSDAKRILNDRNVNTVAVLTRHHLHGKQTVAALKAGKHVFSEKPLALIDKEINSIERALATKNAPMLAIGFNRRFAPLSRQLVKFLEPRTHPVAAHYRVNAGSLPLEHWLHDPQVGGGRLVGEGCHFIDYLVFLAGSKPVSVTAQALPDEGQFRQDNVQVTFRFANGSLGTLTYLANGDRALPKERLEVFSGGKTAVLDDFRSLDLSEGGRTKGLRMSQDKGHREIWRAFITASQKGGNPPIPYAELFSGARATLAALKSLEIGGEVLL